MNVVSSGAVNAPFLRAGTGRGDDPTAPLRFEMGAHLARLPLNPLALPTDVGALILSMLGPASAYMTGEVLHISGGAVMA